MVLANKLLECLGILHSILRKSFEAQEQRAHADRVENLDGILGSISGA
jgi:hypothetical protein